MKIILLLLWIPFISCLGQVAGGSNEGDSVNYAAYFINTRPTHPLGIWLTRSQSLFRTRPLRRWELTAQVSSGNVWLPQVVAYHPLLAPDRAYLQGVPWHERIYHFDPANQPAEQMTFAADGVLRLYHLGLLLPVGQHSEWGLTGRAYSLDRGGVPFSLITSDAFIEWFHSNIAGGEDPFGRRRYGFDGAGVTYADTRGRQLRIENGQVGVAGFDINYRHYIRAVGLNDRGIYPNVGALVGINTSRVNATVDAGLLATVVWKSKGNKRTGLTVGIGIDAIRQGAVRLRDGVQLTDRKMTYAAELMVAGRWATSSRHLLTLAFSGNVHSSYFRPGVDDYYVLEGERVTSHWPYAVSHLYKPLSGFNLSLGYGGGKTDGSVYLRQDYFVDNAPDLQGGMGVRISL